MTRLALATPTAPEFAGLPLAKSLAAAPVGVLLSAHDNDSRHAR